MRKTVPLVLLALVACGGPDPSKVDEIAASVDQLQVDVMVLKEEVAEIREARKVRAIEVPSPQPLPDPEPIEPVKVPTTNPPPAPEPRTPAPASPSVPEVSLMNIRAALVDTGRLYWTFGWAAQVRNNGPSHASDEVRVDFVDASGVPIEQDSKDFQVLPRGIQDVRGQALISSEAAGRVVGVEASIGSGPIQRANILRAAPAPSYSSQPARTGPAVEQFGSPRLTPSADVVLVEGSFRNRSGTTAHGTIVVEVTRNGRPLPQQRADVAIQPNQIYRYTISVDVFGGMSVDDSYSVQAWWE